jgi:pimeloyl-ACP methyl ester carboxylesterase
MHAVKIEILNGAVFRRSGTETGPTILFLHCYGDSSRAFDDVLSAPTLQEFNLVAPDLWGFGASPGRTHIRTIDEFTAALIGWAGTRNDSRPLGVVAHSIMSEMAGSMCRHLGEQAAGLFSIEGCLTPEDVLYPGKAQAFSDPDLFKQAYLEELWHLAKTRPAMRRYFASATLADPVTLWELGRDSFRKSRGDVLANTYLSIVQPKMYYWSSTSTPEATQHFLKKYALPNLEYESEGHWPMIDTPSVTAMQISRFFGKIFHR